MSEQINVNSVEALVHFRTQLVKFKERIANALLEADAEMQHTLNWLQSDQKNFWNRRIQSLNQKMHEAKNALAMKQHYAMNQDNPPSTVDEEKEVARLKRKIEEAEQKLAAIKKWSRQLDQEILTCKGQLQTLSNFVEGEIPTGMARLNRMVEIIQNYLKTQSESAQEAARPSTDPSHITTDTERSMSRAQPPPQQTENIPQSDDPSAPPTTDTEGDQS